MFSTRHSPIQRSQALAHASGFALAFGKSCLMQQLVSGRDCEASEPMRSEAISHTPGKRLRT